MVEWQHFGQIIISIHDFLREKNGNSFECTCAFLSKVQEGTDSDFLNLNNTVHVNSFQGEIF